MIKLVLTLALAGIVCCIPQPRYGGSGNGGEENFNDYDYDGGDDVYEQVVNRKMFFFAKPYDGSDQSYSRTRIVPNTETDLSMVFIRAPETSQGETVIVPPANKKQLIYVLSTDNSAEREVVRIEADDAEPSVYYLDHSYGQNPILPESGIDLETALNAAGPQARQRIVGDSGRGNGGSGVDYDYGVGQDAGGADYDYNAGGSVGGAGDGVSGSGYDSGTVDGGAGVDYDYNAGGAGGEGHVNSGDLGGVGGGNIADSVGGGSFGSSYSGQGAGFAGQGSGFGGQGAGFGGQGAGFGGQGAGFAGQGSGFGGQGAGFGAQGAGFGGQGAGFGGQGAGFGGQGSGYVGRTAFSSSGRGGRVIALPQLGRSSSRGFSGRGSSRRYQR